jgi:rod shape-determining protein MreD
MMSFLFVAAMLILDLILMVLFRVDHSAMMLSFIPGAALVYIAFETYEDPLNIALFWAFFSGLFFDLLLFNALFDYALSMVIVVIVVRIWSKHLSESIIERIMLGLLLIFVREMSLYGLALLQGFTTMNIQTWLTMRVFLTILGNIPVILIVLFWLDFQDGFDAKQQRKQRRKERVSWYRYK